MTDVSSHINCWSLRPRRTDNLGRLNGGAVQLGGGKGDTEKWCGRIAAASTNGKRGGVELLVSRWIDVLIKYDMTILRGIRNP